MWAVWTLLLWWADYFGHGWLLVWLVARLCFVLRLLATNGQGWVVRQLTVEPQVFWDDCWPLVCGVGPGLGGCKTLGVPLKHLLLPEWHETRNLSQKEK